MGQKDCCDWVICDTDFLTWRCMRCEGTYELNLKISQPLWAVSALIKGFNEVHRDCKEETCCGIEDFSDGSNTDCNTKTCSICENQFFGDECFHCDRD